MKRILTFMGVMLACMIVPVVASAQRGYQVKGVVVDDMGPVIGAYTLTVSIGNADNYGAE